MLVSLVLSSAFAAPTAPDFNGDTWPDLAIGATTEKVGSEYSAGAVSILLSEEWGFCRADGEGTCTGNQFLHQDRPHSPDAAEERDYFGQVLASGDFDGDGHDDLAVGAPHTGVAGVPFAGVVDVLYGSVAGLTDQGALTLSGDALSASGQQSRDDGQFGTALTVGRFNADEYDDLAITIRRYGAPTRTSGDPVLVVDGSGSGLDSATARMLDVQGDYPALYVGDAGTALTAADYDGDGYDDLVVGAPYGLGTKGFIATYPGSPSGPRASATWIQSDLRTSDPDSTAETYDLFGSSLH